MTLPPLTVVMSLTDHRGWTERAIESWNRQTYPRQRISLLLFHDGSVESFARTLPALLEPQDELVESHGKSEIALYDLGTRHARTEWVFLSEPHVEVRSTFAEETIRYLLESGLDGAACHSEGCSENNFVGRIEDEVFALDLAEKCEPGHWNKILLRGCCFKRSAYIACGGLDERFGHFSEPLLGARLHAAGFRIGYASRAVCFHHGTDRFRTLIDEQLHYGRREMLCCAHLDPAFESRYFDLMESVRGECFVPARLVRELYRLRRSWRGQTNAIELPRARALRQSTRRTRHSVFRTLIRAMPILLHAARWSRWPRRRLALDLWRSANRYGRETYLMHYWRSPTLDAGIDRLAAGNLGPHNAFGFFDLERDESGEFRWCTGAAFVLLPLAQGCWEVSLETRRGGVDGRRILLASGDARMERQLAEDNPLTLTIRVNQTSRATPLFIVVDTFVPARGGGEDHRSLGVACTGLRWRPTRLGAE